VERALGAAATRALAATGLAEVGAEVVPHARVLPVDEMLLASDGFSRDIDDPANYVASYTPTARLCDVLTVRRRARRALDVGTGGGIQAVLAARHSGSVVATDVNPRALAYTALNAALNGLDEVETRQGSLFDAAGDEQFDLVTCNAPYVVSPERRWAYRDSGFWGDGVSERVIAGAAAHLREGGYATVLVSWIARDADEPEERVIEWVSRTGCDAWILSLYGADPLEHAASWNSHLAHDPRAYGAAIDAWAAYVRELDAEWVAEGAVILHRRRGARRPLILVGEADPDELEDADAQIRRGFAARARLDELRRRADLLDLPLAVASPLRVEHTVGRGRATVVIEEGTFHAVETTREAAAVLERLDVRRPARDALAGVEARRALPLLRELAELGALRIG